MINSLLVVLDASVIRCSWTFEFSQEGLFLIAVMTKAVLVGMKDRFDMTSLTEPSLSKVAILGKFGVWVDVLGYVWARQPF